MLTGSPGAITRLGRIVNVSAVNSSPIGGTGIVSGGLGGDVYGPTRTVQALAVNGVPGLASTVPARLIGSPVMSSNSEQLVRKSSRLVTCGNCTGIMYMVRASCTKNPE